MTKKGENERFLEELKREQKMSGKFQHPDVKTNYWIEAAQDLMNRGYLTAGQSVGYQQNTIEEVARVLKKVHDKGVEYGKVAACFQEKYPGQFADRQISGHYAAKELSPGAELIFELRDALQELMCDHPSGCVCFHHLLIRKARAEKDPRE